MKPIMLASLVFLLAISACGQPISNPVQIPAETDWITFTTGSFTVDLPSTWVEEASSDEQVIYAVSAGTASLWIKSWPLIPGLVSKSVHDWVDGNEAVSLLSESRGSDEIHLELALTEGFRVMRLSTLLIYCDAKAYEVTGTALERDFKRYKAIIDQTHSSAVCQPPERYPDLDSGALGMVIIPPAVDGNDFDPAAYQESLALARKNGVQVSHYYFHWGDIEVEPGIYDWTVPDYILEANALEGLQLSIVVSVIHTTVRGRIPSDLRDRSFDDPVFIQRLSDFLSAFAERYKGHLHYLAIGNEVNNYFADHRDQIPAYASAFDRARTAIHTVNPGLPVGIIFAYHDAETLGTTDVIQQLNRGDYIAYTLYLYNQGFHFQRDPSLIGDYLNRMVALAGDTPIVITETGWSTATELHGSQAGQAEYVSQLFNALSERRNSIRFVSWFILHDPLPDTCQRDALTFFEPGVKPDLDSDAMQAFVTFICHFGLRFSDGTPKQAWDVWVRQVEEYYH